MTTTQTPTTRPVEIADLALGPRSCSLKCPACHALALSVYRVEHALAGVVTVALFCAGCSSEHDLLLLPDEGETRLAWQEVLPPL